MSRTSDPVVSVVHVCQRKSDFLRGGRLRSRMLYAAALLLVGELRTVRLGLGQYRRLVDAGVPVVSWKRHDKVVRGR
jgi:hypothetical protein